MYYNKNKVLIVCLALLLSMVVGYALFSDDIEINASGETKGDFSYEITTMKGIDPVIKTSDMYAVLNNYGTTGAETSFGSEEGILDSSITSSGNTIAISANFTAPLQNQYFTVKITNEGSIPISLDYTNIGDGSISYEGDFIRKDGSILTFPCPSGTNTWECTVSVGAYDDAIQPIEVYVSKKAYDEHNVKISSNSKALPKLETNESVYILFLSKWPDYLDKINSYSGYDLTFTYNDELLITQNID